ncbi:MAG: hypothetical protein ACLPT6_14345 [Desulfobaccales bacterium]
MKVGAKESLPRQGELDKNFPSWEGNLKSGALIESLSGSGKRYITVLEAYLDESGTHVGANLLCVAAYVGNRKEWLAFEEKWQKEIDRAKLSCFHAKEPKSRLLKLPLIEAIENRNFTGFICSVRPEVFNLHAGPQYRSSLGNAYSACTLTVAKGVFDLTKDKKLGPILFYIEDGQPNARFVERTLRLLLNNRQFPVAGVFLGRKDEFLPLQTADFLAHSYAIKDQPWLDLLLRRRKVHGGEMTAEHLINASREIKKLISRQRNIRRKANRGRIEI